MPMGMKVIDKSLSGHCHLMKTCATDLMVCMQRQTRHSAWRQVAFHGHESEKRSCVAHPHKVLRLSASVVPSSPLCLVGPCITR